MPGATAAHCKLSPGEPSDGWEFDGRKTFITGGSRANVLIVLAKSGETDAGKAEMSAFLISPEHVRRIRRIRTYGMRASDTADIRMDAVPGELLGERGRGQRGRIGAAMVALVDATNLSLGLQPMGA